MAEFRPYSGRFEIGRLFADGGRVLARAGLPILAGVLVVGVVPAVISSVPWWQAAPGTPPASAQQTWTLVTAAKLALTLAAFSATSVWVTASALAVLTDAGWGRMLRPGRLAVGFATMLSVQAVASWAGIVETFVMGPGRTFAYVGFLSLAGEITIIPIMAFFGLATAAALGEQRFVFNAIARSVRLLRGLRWRMAAFAIGYLVVQTFVSYLAAITLFVSGVPYMTPGMGRAALSVAPLLVGVFSSTLVASFYLQARRIADGPSASELHDVFS